jgi:hypothetical protein
MEIKPPRNQNEKIQSNPTFSTRFTPPFNMKIIP